MTPGEVFFRAMCPGGRWDQAETSAQAHAGVAIKDCWESMAGKVLDGRLTANDATMILGSATSHWANYLAFTSAERALRRHAAGR